MFKTKNKKKVKYFRIDQFVNDAIVGMKLGDVPALKRMEIENAIAEHLGERILNTVIDSFGEREIHMYENMLVDHPELDEMDILWLVAHDVKGLKEKIMREVNSYYQKLVGDAGRIEKAMKTWDKK